MTNDYYITILVKRNKESYGVYQFHSNHPFFEGRFKYRIEDGCLIFSAVMGMEDGGNKATRMYEGYFQSSFVSKDTEIEHKRYYFEEESNEDELIVDLLQE